jgi:plastocyanin
VIIIIIIAAVQSSKNTNTSGVTGSNGSQNSQTAGSASSTTVAPSATVSTASQGLQNANVANLKGAKVVVPGANPITTDNKVVTASGEVTANNVRSISANAPKPTGLLDKSTLPKTLVQINVTSTGFSPKEITAQAGAPLSFSLTSADSFVHVLAFNDSSLSAITILVGPGQTKAITFNAPAKAGSYTFYDSAADNSVTGTLIVK